MRIVLTITVVPSTRSKNTIGPKAQKEAKMATFTFIAFCLFLLVLIVVVGTFLWTFLPERLPAPPKEGFPVQFQKVLNDLIIDAPYRGVRLTEVRVLRGIPPFGAECLEDVPVLDGYATLALEPYKGQHISVHMKWTEGLFKCKNETFLHLTL